MIRSMTGFGRAQFEVEGSSFEVEVRSVNHRYLDLRVRLPRSLSLLEPEVRERVQPFFDRGKVDVTIQMASGSAPKQDLEIDQVAVGRYLKVADALRAQHGLSGGLDVDEVLSLPGVARFVEHEFSREALRVALLDAAEEAAHEAEAMRCAEGGALECDLLERLDGVSRLIAEIQARAGTVQEAARERLRKKAEALADETGVRDEARLTHEIVLTADRLDITEELVRLASHVDQFRVGLAEAVPGNPVGRRLDFLLQEFGREANTIGSKGSDASLAHQVVELKTELERVREQVQNVE